MLFREISTLIQQAALDDPDLTGIGASRVELSDDGSHCMVYFFSERGQEQFDRFLDKLKLYRPSMRTALAKRLSSRRVPQILFKYDVQFAKTKEVEELLDLVKKVDEWRLYLYPWHYYAGDHF